MKAGSVVKFIVGGTAALAVGGVALLVWLSDRGASSSFWAGAGYAAMAVPGLVFGAWLAREHGRPGTRFLGALASGFVTRLVLAAVAAFGAAHAGGDAGAGLIAGLAAGFVPLTAFETVWFTLQRPAAGFGTEKRA